MAGKPVAVKGMKISIIPPLVTGKIKIVSKPSKKTKVKGKGVYFRDVKIKITDIRLLILGSLKPGKAEGKMLILFPSSKTDGKSVLREGDISLPIKVQGAMHPGQNGIPTKSPIFFMLQVEKAGQKTFTSA